MQRLQLQSLAAVLLAAASPAALTAQPAFTKAFGPPTIGPGSVSTLIFTIDNSASGTPVLGLAFTDNLPAGVVVASPAQAASTCGGTLTAAAGAGAVSLSGGSVEAFAACSVRVDVTSATAGVHTNTTDDLTSSAGNSGGAMADLTVVTTRPGFTKSFTPASVPLGQRSQVALTIDNSANGSAASLLAFTDTLPPGLVVAGPANASSECSPGVLTATPGAGSVSFSGGAVGANQSCAVFFDVVAGAVGFLGNTTGELTSTSGGPLVSSGKAGAVLEVTADPIVLVKSFLDDPVAPGGTVTLRFTLINFDRDFAATGLTFSDDLDAALSGLAGVGLPLADPCGTGSQLSGMSVLTLTGGNLPPEGSCTFDVTLQVPAAASPGVYTNATSQLTGTVDGAPVSGAPAVEQLFVQSVPLFTKEFTDDPVAAGGTVTLEFTITNTSPDFDLTDITFTDSLDAITPGLTATLPAAGFCGAGSTMTLQNNVLLGDFLQMTGGSLGQGASCTFQVLLDVPVGIDPGTYPNVTGPLSGVIAQEEPVEAPPATDDLVVLAAPRLTKAFLGDPALPDDVVTLEFTLALDPNAPAAATDIAFSDDLDAALSSLSSIGLPLADPCGAGSLLEGSPGPTNLVFSGGSLAPGASCTFSVAILVPFGAAPGDHLNTTSDVTATMLATPVVSPPASDALTIASLVFAKSFDDPVVPGGLVDLTFTIANLSPSADATAIAFTDDLAAALAGLAAVGLPLADPCGSGSQLDGTTLLTFTGGSLLAGSSCSFTVTLQVPAAAAAGEYLNLTSSLAADFDGEPITIPRASDTLTVADPLAFSKEFTDDPATSPGTVTLEFTIANADPILAVTGLAFTDDLDAVLSGLVATGLPAAACGGTLSGTSTLTFAGGTLAAASSCTFAVTLQVPAGVPFGTVITNTTSPLTGTAAGNPVTAPPASDDLEIDFLVFTKSFDGPAPPGGNALLSFTIENLGAAAAGISFTDDLGAVLPGLVAVGLPQSGVCGPASELSGTSLLTLTGGALAAGASCTFAVTLQVPVAAASGGFLNTTSTLLVAGLPAAAPATATLEIAPPPGFAKEFSPPSIPVGGTSTLILTIDNGASALPASGLAFSDALPAGMEIASPPNAATTCSGGTLTAVAGAALFAYSGGSVAAGATCTASVDVTGTAPGGLLNSVVLASSLGTTGIASATLSVEAQASLLEIPTVAPWGLVLLGALLLLAGTHRLRGAPRG